MLRRFLRRPFLLAAFLVFSIHPLNSQDHSRRVDDNSAVKGFPSIAESISEGKVDDDRDGRVTAVQIDKRSRSESFVPPQTITTPILAAVAAGVSIPTSRDSIAEALSAGVSMQPAALSFTDITLSAGTGGPTASGQTGGHGAMFCDVNADGRPDLYITMLFNSPMNDLFFRNTGGNVFADEAALRGIADFDGGSHGGTFVDLDNDGDYDFVNGTTTSAPGFPAINNIYRNDGTGFFTDVSSTTGIPFREWPTRGVIAFDMERDGDLDLFCVTNYQGTLDPPGETNEVYRNDGNLQFTALDFGALFTAPAGQGAIDTDYDGDGDIDVLTGNRTGDVNILKNDGLGNFTLIAPATVGITHLAGDGITTGDIDNDGDLDMVLVTSPDAALYRNNGNGSFSFVTTFLAIDGYMGGLADLDNDGDLDLIFSGDSKCYLNDGAGNFVGGPAISVTGINDPRAIGFADIDDDGDLDFAVGVKRSRNWLVRNNFNSGNWLKIKLISSNGQAGAYGAKTRIYPAGQAGGQLLGLREARSSYGYLGQDDQILHFGLGARTAVDVVVTFLNGTTITQSNVAANQTITISGVANNPQLPTITSFSPSSGTIATQVTISGSNFAGATSVAFNGTSASFAIDSNTQIRATVPAGATTGKISVTNAAGTATSLQNFTVLIPPTITSFTPTSGAVGTQVTISGNNFVGATGVTFSGAAASVFTVLSNNQVLATVPTGATTGKIGVTTAAGSVLSAQDFSVTSGGGGGTFTFNPIADTYVRSTKPTNNYGAETGLQLRKATGIQNVYLKFNVSGLSGTIQSAKLRLFVTDDGPDGGSIYSVSNNYLNSSTPWLEAGLIWDNAPPISGTALSSVGSVALNQVVEFDVTPQRSPAMASLVLR